MDRVYGTWDAFLIEQLAEEEDMSGFLDAVMEEYQSHGNAAVIQISLESIIKAKGGIAEVAKKTDIDPQTLTGFLTNKKALHIDTLTTVLSAIGCRLSIVSLDSVEIGADVPIGIPSNPQSIVVN
ncbi:hypothetical protein F4X73_03775 [Candidatus Poribacteria bacterium]|nr:hypothetical protein [Candidatus Poribacteria bacterium]